MLEANTTHKNTNKNSFGRHPKTMGTCFPAYLSVLLDIVPKALAQWAERAPMQGAVGALLRTLLRALLL